MPYIADNHAIINTCGDRFLAVAKKQNITKVWYQAIKGTLKNQGINFHKNLKKIVKIKVCLK